MPSGNISKVRPEVWISRSALQTERIAAALARRLSPGAVLALTGDLGTGKTTFVRGLASALGCRDGVKSPTFVLMHEYPGRRTIYHFDFYRLQDPEEVEGLGVQEVFDSCGVSVVEWADRFAGLFPPRTVWIRFSHEGPTARRITCRPG